MEHWEANRLSLQLFSNKFACRLSIWINSPAETKAAFLEELTGSSGFTVLPSTVCATQWGTRLGNITSAG